jgi:hypothetical protein
MGGLAFRQMFRAHPRTRKAKEEVMSKNNRKRRRELGLLPPREFCTARSKRTGTPCKNAPLEGSTVCRLHGGLAPQVLRKSQERIVMAQDDAASNLVRWMQDPEVPFSERRKCAEALLNRGGNAPGQHLQISAAPAPWELLLQGKDGIDGIVAEVGAEALRPQGMLDRAVVDGELVADEAPPAAPPTPKVPSRRKGNRVTLGR